MFWEKITAEIHQIAKCMCIKTIKINKKDSRTKNIDPMWVREQNREHPMQIGKSAEFPLMLGGDGA